MTPDLLKRRLEEAGLDLLGVGYHRASPDAFVVYLNGSAGQYVGGYARHVITCVTRAKSVVDSVTSPNIILALEPAAEPSEVTPELAAELAAWVEAEPEAKEPDAKEPDVEDTAK